MKPWLSQPDPLSLPPEQREVVCVLGGRSGTSLITRLVNMLGVDLGPPEHMIPANSANQAGFWEHREIVALNDEILARHGAKWPRLVPLPRGWEQSSQLDDLRERALQLIRAEFARARLWGWKDPRACVTLPFWQRLVPHMRYILCFRNPVDTASSNAKTLRAVAEQAAGDGLAEMQKALYLTGLTNWIEFVRLMLRHTADSSRMAVLFEDVMEETEGELQRVARFIGRPSAASDPDVLKAAGEFKDERLRGHNTSPERVLEERALPDVAKSAYISLRAHVAREREAYQASEHGEAMRDASAVPGDGLLVEWEEKQADSEALEINVRGVLAAHTPTDALVLIGSHGDEELRGSVGRTSRHFPHDVRGEYLGCHPADSTHAILALREAQARGGTHLLIPQRQFWWLDHYAGFREHLEDCHRNLYRDEWCVLYQLRQRRA